MADGQTQSEEAEAAKKAKASRNYAANLGSKIEMGGGILGAFGTILGGRQQKQAMYANAGLEDFNANQVDYMGKYALINQKRKADQVIGAARAQYGASGVQSNEGSPLDILQQSAANAALDHIMLKYNYDLESYGHRRSAQAMRQEGDQAETNSYLSAGAQLVSGAGKAIAGMG